MLKMVSIYFPSIATIEFMFFFSKKIIVTHPISCDACQRDNFMGFRYRCQKCHSFQMCQECFWRGRVASSHTIEHDVKEYTSYVCMLLFSYILD